MTLLAATEKRETTVEENEKNVGHEESPESSVDLQSLPEEVAHVLEQIIQERDEAEQARVRALADFKNFQRRSIENEQRSRRDGASGIVRGLLPALDNLDLALQNAEQATSIDQVLQGVRIAKEELRRALEAHGVTIVHPSPGDEFDPEQHEAVAEQPFEGIAQGAIGETIQSGYALSEIVLRPAKVVLAGS